MKSYSPSCLSNYTPTVRIQVITACCQGASLPIRCRKRPHQKQKQKWGEGGKEELTKQRIFLQGNTIVDYLSIFLVWPLMISCTSVKQYPKNNGQIELNGMAGLGWPTTVPISTSSCQSRGGVSHQTFNKILKSMVWTFLNQKIWSPASKPLWEK